MPEYRECIAHFLFLLWFLRYCQQKGLDLHVLGLWTDKTAGKKGKKPKPTDLVFMLDHNSKDKRGNAGNQGYLWPPMWRKSSENPNPPSISLLELQGVRTTSRAIILNFGALHFQLAYLTHTSVQCFNKHTWDTVIRKTPIATRGYRIALAIEFSDYVMAFLSIDQLIQVLYYLFR
ncbi:hypothetical protein M413DRAFT_64021 [Hebeloma cylindrosporum]|uniref:Uncharacterized protein n=1 Tax=Hebeloma cylindrosporum TaxID=76867 RepID=A0A0C3CTG1_HEBCY|nr:hypothetical protein M413DRAFT_64021 [Hebeloma cylindrosporum h7]